MSYNPLAWQSSQSGLSNSDPAAQPLALPVAAIPGHGQQAQQAVHAQQPRTYGLQHPQVALGPGYNPVVAGQPWQAAGPGLTPLPQQQQAPAATQAHLPPHLRAQEHPAAQTHLLVPTQQQHALPPHLLPPHLQQQKGSVLLPPHMQQQQQQQQQQGSILLPPQLQHQQQQQPSPQPTRPLPGIAGILSAARDRASSNPVQQQPSSAATPAPSPAQQQQQQSKPLIPPGMPVPAAAAAAAVAAGRGSSKLRTPPPGFSTPGGSSSAAASAAGYAVPSPTPAARTPPPPAAGPGAMPHIIQQMQPQLQQQRRRQQEEQAVAAPTPPQPAVQQPSPQPLAPPPPQQQQQQPAVQQPAPQQPAPQQQQQAVVAFAQPKPRLTLEAALELLGKEASAVGGSSIGSSSVNFSVREGFKWLARYAPDASQLLHGDEGLKEYLKFVLSRHGPGVLSCVVFFTFGHHEEFRGATQSLTLATAGAPVRVLNQRISYYRLMFDPENSPSRTRADAQAKTQVMVALLAHRPDVACDLTHASLRAIFEKGVTPEAGRATLAALLLLPHGWQEAVQPSPRAWLGCYVTAALRDAKNADSMVTYLEKKLAAVTPATAAAEEEEVAVAAAATALRPGSSSAAQAGALPAAAAAPQQLGGSSSSSAGGIQQLLAQANARFQQQQQQAPAPAAAAVVAANGRRSSFEGGSFADMLKPQQQQQQAAAAAPAGSSSIPERQQQASGTSSRQTPPASATGGAAAASANADSGSRGGSSSSNAELIELALVQLTKDRPDVVRCATRALRDRIKSLPLPAALNAVYELSELPRGWEHACPQNPTQHLEVVVGRAAAHACADGAGTCSGGGAGGAAADGDDSEQGWVKLGEAGGRPAVGGGLVGPAGSSSGKGAAKSGSIVQAAWARLERERPDVAAHLAARHRAMIKQLLAEQQLQLLQLLHTLGRSCIANASDAQGMLYKLISNAVHMMTQPAPKELQAALSRLSQQHPYIMAYMDDGVYARISALPLNKALLAVKALDETDYGERWEARTKNHSAWLMGVISRALREAGH